MQHRLFWFRARSYKGWYFRPQLFVVALLISATTFVTPASAAMRMQDRHLYMNSARVGDITSYTIAMRYMSPVAVGSVDLMFCIDPIPYHACVTPPGLDVSAAVLSSQLGETGFSILSKTTNHIVLTRPPSMIMAGGSSYTFDNIVNPTNTDQSFSVRMRTHASQNATGPQIDFGSIKGQVTEEITIQTQVPPMLIFCMAEEVADDCVGTNEVYYNDMGLLAPDATLFARSQMAVGTNATAGFVITANGLPPSAGTHTIDSPLVPTISMPGTNQFGINLVANSTPAIGDDPQGTWANAIASPDYSVTNHYKFVSGDVVAYSPNVSLMKKFTISYVLNSHPDLRAGVYTTTITYIASGRF